MRCLSKLLFDLASQSRIATQIKSSSEMKLLGSRWERGLLVVLGLIVVQVWLTSWWRPTTTMLVAQRKPGTNFTVDILSIGSLSRPEYMETQRATFGSHLLVRNFVSMDERDDADQDCHNSLTEAGVDHIKDLCQQTPGDLNELGFRKDRFKPRGPGWLCAQKRPIDGLRKLRDLYYAHDLLLPSYLLLIDDDTYLNIPKLLQTLTYDVRLSYVLTGCRINRHGNGIDFRFAYGGLGTILTKAALERLLRPIDCENTESSDDFAMLACWRLQQNIVGEAAFFRNSMSILDLMIAYSDLLPFSDTSHWSNETSFCFHSDHAIGYFLAFYHITVPSFRRKSSDVLLDDRWRRRFPMETLEEKCPRDRSPTCVAGGSICHYAQPHYMEQLFTQQGGF